MKTLFLKYFYLKTTILFLDESTSEAKIWSQFPFPWCSQMSPWDFFYFAFSSKNWFFVILQKICSSWSFLLFLEKWCVHVSCCSLKNDVFMFPVVPWKMMCSCFLLFLIKRCVCYVLLFHGNNLRHVGRVVLIAFAHFPTGNNLHFWSNFPWF